MYVGLETRTVRVPREVRTSEGDDSVIEICYDETDVREITVERWKNDLAQEWGISLSELREMARQDIR